MRLLCHGSFKPAMRRNKPEIKHAAPGGIVYAARCMRPAIDCISFKVSKTRDLEFKYSEADLSQKM